MNNILLIEPNYQAKYPPLGLMKIAFYHNHIRKDKNVIFVKGFLPEHSVLSSTSWDRIYVSTLFTYEWEKTINTIEYAKQLIYNDLTKIVVGGSAATLMADEILKETNIKAVSGLVNEPNKIGFEDDCMIDNLPPDYSILEQSNYKYPYEKAYFAFTTRGCGMNCSFCAVKKLEPKYIDYISIKNQIDTVRKYDQVDGKNGEIRRDLLLLDNNVLKSKKFSFIIKDIEELGFRKGATFTNQLSGKTNQRHVDFNQGLDANLITEEKARLLGRIALKPVRIAFDHIEDKDIYEKAIRVCHKNGLKYFSNYILYNTDQTTGKGQKYDADTPKDLYNRLKITMHIKESINIKNSKNPIQIYSFPMKYVPLNSKSRDYVGLKWNKKYLRAVRIMLTPTQGKGVSGKDFFEAAFGKCEDEFKMNLFMPESILAGRGKIVNTNSVDIEKIQSKVIHDKCYKEWVRLFNNIGNEEEILETIEDNCFSPDNFFSIKSNNMKLLYLYYLSPFQVLKLFISVTDNDDKDLLASYFTKTASFYLNKIIAQAIKSNYSYNLLSGLVDLFNKHGIISLIQAWINRKCIDLDFPNNLNNLYILTNTPKYIEPELLSILKQYFKLEVLTEEDINEINESVATLDIAKLKESLYVKFPHLKNKLNKRLLTEKTGTSILRKRLQIIERDIENKLTSQG